MRNINTCRTISHPLMAVSQLFLVPNAAQSARATTISIISTPAVGEYLPSGRNHRVRGDLLRRGRRARHAAARPCHARCGGDAASEFRASYVRRSSATKLVFAYTVAAGDRSTTTASNSDRDTLRLNPAAARITVRTARPWHRRGLDQVTSKANIGAQRSTPRGTF